MCAPLCGASVGFIIWRPASCMCCFKEGRRSSEAQGPVYHPSYLSPRQPPEGGQGSVRTSGNSWGVNLNSRETAIEGARNKGMKRMTGDKPGWVREKCRGRVDNEERERWRGGWQVIVAVGVTGSRRQTEERMKKSIDIPHKTVSSHLRGSLWLQTLPFTLSLSMALSILWLPLADARALRQWKTKNIQWTAWSH